MNSTRLRLYCPRLFLLVPTIFIMHAAPAAAHVKWFAPYDITSQPQRLGNVFSPLFIELFLLAVVLLWMGCAIERTRLGTAVQMALDSVFDLMALRSDALIRSGVAAFCIAIWVTGGIILTPELKTSVAATSWLQAAIAVGTFWQPTMVLSGLGIVVLFAQGIWFYGVFHMMDYPIFLGAAAYLIMRGLGLKSVLGVRPLDIVLWGSAVTLMWASVEKWAYPDWSYPVLNSHPEITAGFTPHFYMVAAGIVEFTLSFALLWTPLVRRVAAIVLISMFASAIVAFGKIDAIGHLLIVVLLLVIAADNEPIHRCSPKMLPVWYSTALVMTIYAYYLGHYWLYGTPIV